MFSVNRENILEFLRDIIGITVGTAVCGFAFSMFLIPFKAAPGGVGALSQLFFYFLKIPAGIAMLIFNIPLFVIGVLTLGKMFGFKTLYAIFSVSLFTDLLSYRSIVKIAFLKDFLYKINEQAYSFTNEVVLGVCGGATLLGVGIGIVFKYNGSTGGTDIPALLLKKYLGISIGTAFLMLDTIIIIIVGIVFKAGNLIFWGLISLFISAKVTDYINEGLPHAKGTFIITKEPEQIKHFIINALDRGCTVFKGEGGYSGTPKDIVYVVINLRELTKLKDTIKKIDKEAFVIVNDVHEVLGHGFKKF